MSDALTGPQMRALQTLADLTRDGRTVHPRAVARALWPDSEAWNRRTRFHASAANNQGAVGGTMPMKAATLLWRLHERGLASEDDRAWQVTGLGHRVLAGEAEPRPKYQRPEPARGERKSKP